MIGRRFPQTYGANTGGTELEVIDEGECVRIRVREPHDKVSIFMTDAEISPRS